MMYFSKCPSCDVDAIQAHHICEQGRYSQCPSCDRGICDACENTDQRFTIRLRDVDGQVAEVHTNDIFEASKWAGHFRQRSVGLVEFIDRDETAKVIPMPMTKTPCCIKCVSTEPGHLAQVMATGRCPDQL